MTRLLVAALLLVSQVARADTKTVAKEVSRARGLSIKRPIEADVVPPESFHAEGREAAYYDVPTKKILMTGPVDDATLVHVIAHALQDQHFDLSKLDTGEGDEALARHALVEGDAIVTTMEVLLARKSIDPPWSNPAVIAELARAIQVPVDPASRAGFAFVAALRATHPWSSVDDALKHPPRSTEQILHPEKYFAAEQPIEVDAPVVAGVTAQTTTTWGELGFREWLEAHAIDATVAELAAAGWGGDRVITFAHGAVGRFVWDSDIDAIEAYDAVVRALEESQLAATFEHTESSTRWLALDGTVSYVVRDGTTLELGFGLPAR